MVWRLQSASVLVSCVLYYILINQLHCRPYANNNLKIFDTVRESSNSLKYLENILIAAFLTFEISSQLFYLQKDVDV